MPTCSFCGKSYIASGMMLVLDTGKIFNFCTKKCEKNMMKLKRNPRHIGWVRKKKK